MLGRFLSSFLAPRRPLSRIFYSGWVQAKKCPHFQACEHRPLSPHPHWKCWSISPSSSGPTQTLNRAQKWNLASWNFPGLQVKPAPPSTESSCKAKLLRKGEASLEWRWLPIWNVWNLRFECCCLEMEGRSHSDIVGSKLVSLQNKDRDFLKPTKVSRKSHKNELKVDTQIL